MTGPELDEVARIITHALITYPGGDRLARGRHIVQELEAQDWHMIKETDG